MLQLTRAPGARAEMLIRKPVAYVFQAFVDPAVTTQFWFTRSSGRLETGQRVRWVWEMYDVSMEVTVRSVEANERILVDWPGDDGGHTTVEWTFTPQNPGATFVSITNSGFTGDGDQVTRQAVGKRWPRSPIDDAVEHQRGADDQ